MSASVIRRINLTLQCSAISTTISAIPTTTDAKKRREEKSETSGNPNLDQRLCRDDSSEEASTEVRGGIVFNSGCGRGCAMFFPVNSTNYQNQKMVFHKVSFFFKFVESPVRTNCLFEIEIRPPNTRSAVRGLARLFPPS